MVDALPSKRLAINWPVYVSQSLGNSTDTCTPDDGEI